MRSELTAADGRPDVRGWAVGTSNGHRIGTAIDLPIDVQSQRVRYHEVEVYEEILGTSDDRAHLFAVGTARLNDDSDEVYLPVSVEDIGALPVYDRNIVHRDDERLLRDRVSGAGATATRQLIDETSQGCCAGNLYDHDRFW